MSNLCTPFTDAELSEYQSLIGGRGMVKLANWTCVVLQGTDRALFLNGFCTNDIKSLQPGDGCEAFITDVKGKVVGHGLVICEDQQLNLITVPGQAEVIIAHLDRYIIRENVQLSDTTSEKTCLLTTWTGTPMLLKQVVRCDWLRPADTALVVVETGDVDHMLRQLESEGVTVCGENASGAARIEAGTPWFETDFDAKNLPQEVGRDRQAISFTKGCYLGQETVARIDALGHVNQQIVSVMFEAGVQPQPGSELTAQGKAVGRVTSVAFSPRLQRPLGLAMVRHQHNASGSQLESSAGPCEVVAFPAAV